MRDARAKDSKQDFSLTRKGLEGMIWEARGREEAPTVQGISTRVNGVPSGYRTT